MIDDFLNRMSQPRYGMVFLSAFMALVMAAHWLPMLALGLGVLILAVATPIWVVRPVVWWLMAAAWLAAVVFVQDRMEDHVWLFVAWLVALALCLGRDDETFVGSAATYARVLLGITFTAAVAWKLYFGSFVSGAALWTFILVDKRFQPLGAMVGLRPADIDRDRLEVSKVLAGDVERMHLDASLFVTWSIVAVSVATLVLEAIIAVSHLVPDSSRLALLRLPSVAVFGITTYSVVPVLPFAVLLAILAIATARWRPEAMWILPLIVISASMRLLFIVV